MKAYTKIFLNISLFINLGIGCIFFYSKPHFNWDTLAYIGCVLELNGDNLEELHNKTYQSLELISERQKLFLTTSSKYKTEMAKSTEGFVQQLPFYRVKPLYVLACYLSYKLGMPLIESMLIPSILSFFFTGIILYYWLKRYLNILVAWSITLLFMFSPSVILLSRITTPDGMSTCILFLGIYLLLEKQNFWLFSILSFFAILTRPDNIIFITLITLVAIISQPIKNFNIKHYLPFVIALGAYCYIKFFINGYPWYTLYHHTFVEKIAYPLKFKSNFSFGIYIQELKNGILSLQYSFTYLPVFLLLMIISIRNEVYNIKSQLLLVFIAVFVAIIIRFLLFPDFSDRFFIIYYLIGIILLVKSLQINSSLKSK